MDVYISDSSEELIRSRKRRRSMVISSDSSDSNQSESDFEFTSVGGVNQNIQNFTRQNTNRFGEEDSSFKEVSVEELEVYFALIILMSMVQKLTLQSYCSTDKSVETPYFKTVMSRNRFMAISRKLNFVDNELLQPDDPLRKIRPIMDMINKRFKEVFTPNRDISLDESLMKYRSRISYIQYNKTKRARFGIKYYKLCASRSKYCDVAKSRRLGCVTNIIDGILLSLSNAPSKLTISKLSWNTKVGGDSRIAKEPHH
ncbi:piggyBac transposable element-derived protein 4-like [Prorops nasuta]|uniref:piggyBac transposable element-derived protein 4-like n=1 Tax=Prorops nasuta TaxID=863751 RepID=UPI0034CD0248